jgi:hypothetical protein
MKFYTILPCAAALISLTACSQSGSVALKGVDVSTSVVGTDTYITMDATVSMGSLKFPNVEVPIINPKGLQVLGQMALQSLSDGTNKLTVSIDYEAATRLDPTLGNSLPNLRELPLQLGIPAGTSIIGIPILQNSRIYVGGDSQKNLYIGAAIAIPAFDTILSQVPLPLNIFFNYPFSTDITGYAGLFTGTQAGENGIGVFVKRSAPTTTTPATAKIMMRSLAQVTTTAKVTTLVTPTGGEELKNLDNYSLYKLDRLLKKKATLRIK